MIGLNIGAWFSLPMEEPCVWMAVSFTTIIVYEVIKIWKALGTRAKEAFFREGKLGKTVAFLRQAIETGRYSLRK